jgi:CBS domain-containing protein
MPDSLTAGALCTRIVNVVERDASLAAAARLMRERHVGCLVVVERDDRGETVVGMLTDRDIVVAAVARDLDARAMKVGEAMTRDVVTAQEADSVLDVLAAMRSRGLRRVPVLGAHGLLTGLLSLDDVLAAVALQVQAMTQAIIVERQHEAAARP